MNVVFVGHVDHGKSTLIGRLLYDSKSIKDDKVTEIQKLVEEYKRRFEFAYFLDAFEDELKEERTIDTVSLMFEGKKNCYTITDVPGHKEFIKNMLTGASHAEVGVLVVSAEEGVKEQTRRHMFLLKMLGIENVLVVINKMDAVGYKKEKFENVKSEVVQLLEGFGYKDVIFIPGSAMEGDNIYRKSDKMDWYEGPTLIEALDGLEIKQQERAMRFVVQDIYEIEGEEIVVGRVESGRLRVKDKVVFEPSGVVTEIEKIKVYGEELQEANMGDCVGIVIPAEVKRGDVGGHIEKPPKPVNKFMGEVVLIDKKLRKGDTVQLKCGTARVGCKIEQIREKIDLETGEVIEQCPEEIKEHEAATIVFNTEPVVVERFTEIPELGRFVVVKGGKNIGAGIVLDLIT